jgi:hypothetical protein
METPSAPPQLFSLVVEQGDERALRLTKVLLARDAPRTVSDRHGDRVAVGVVAARHGSERLLGVLASDDASERVMVAAALGDGPRLRELSRSGADILARDDVGFTALHHCAYSHVARQRPAEFVAVIRHVIESGVSANAEASSIVCPTPLCAVAAGGGCVAVAEALVAAGADPRLRNPLNAALGHFQRHGRGNYEVAGVLVAAGADANALERGRAPIHAFAHHGDAVAVRWLLDHGAQVDFRSADGRTALHHAVERNDSVALARMLLDAGADPKAVDEDGQRPLDYAMLNGKRRVVALLRAL